MSETQPNVTVGMKEIVTVEAGRSRVEDFARASDDYARHHVDDAFASASPLGGSVVHGVLLLGFVSAVSSHLLERVTAHYVTTGYDGVRFKKPVFVDDRVTVHYEVVEADATRGTSTAQFEVTGADGSVCCVGRHLMKRLSGPPGDTDVGSAGA